MVAAITSRFDLSTDACLSDSSLTVIGLLAWTRQPCGSTCGILLACWTTECKCTVSDVADNTTRDVRLRSSLAPPYTAACVAAFVV